MAAVVNTPWTVTASGDAAAGSLSLSGNGSVAVGAGRTLTIMNALTGAAGSTLALGRDATLVIGQTSTLDRLTTSGDAALRNFKGLTLAAFDDNGEAGTLTLHGPGTLSINAAAAAAVVAKDTNFRVQPGATLRVAGAGLLGGDPTITLNGGTFTISPVPANSNAYMQETNVNVLANSTVNAATTGTVALGRLAFDAPSILTTTGQGTLDFFDTTLRAAGTSGINAQVRTIAGGLDANGLATTFVKQGTSDLILTRAGAGLGSTTLDAQAGTLALIGSNTAAGATVRMSGGNVTLGSPDGTSQTFTSPIISTASGTLRAGAAGVGVASGDIAVTSLAPGAGTVVSLASEGGNTLVIAGPVNAPGSLGITQGTVRVANTTVSVNTLAGSSGTTLATEGNVTIGASAAMTLGGQLLVNSGNLTLNVPAGAPPAGAIAYWKFDNAGNLGLDSAGSYNGTLMGSPAPQPVAGRVGGAIDFERDASNYIDLPDGFANFTTGITVAAWVNYESFTNWNRVIDFGTGAGANNILLARNGTSSNVRWEFQSTAGGTESHEVAGVLPNAQWIHVAASCAPGPTNAAVSTIYINGVPVGVKTDHSLPSNVTRTNNYIGESNWGGDDFIDGLMDELVIYNRTLGAAEVQMLYQAGLVGAYTPSLGDVRLAPSTQLTLGGTAVANVNSIGTKSGALVVSGPMTISAPPASPTLSLNAAGDTLALDTMITNATNFLVNGAGTVALNQNLTLASGGTLSLSPGSTLATTNSLTIDATAGRLDMARGALNVTAGTLTIAMPTGAAGALPGGAVAYYSFNDPNLLGRDTGGAGSNLANVGSPSYANSGVLGGSLSLPGASRLTAATFPTGVPTGGSAYSISAWINPNAGAAAWGIVGWGNWGAGSQTNALRMVNATQVLNYWWGNDLTATAPGDLTTGAPPAGWHLVTATYDPTLGSNQHKIYIDGALAAQRTASGLNAQPINFNIGATNNNTEFFNGYLDEVLIYSRALSAADVAGLYQAGAGGGYRSLGALTMAAGTTLRLNAAGTGQADFASITAGNGATIQGSATLLGEMAIGSSPGTLNVVGSFAMAAGSTYHWEHDGTTGDRVAVSGSPGTVNVNSAWNLGISLAGPLSGPYDLITFPWTAIPPTVGAVNVLKENSWAQLISSATVGADNDSVFVNLTLAANSTWTSNVLGQINWQTPTNWAGGVPNLTTAAIVQAPTATQIATILAGDTGQAQMLIIANNGTVQVNGGGTLQVGSGGIYVDPTGTLRLDEGSTLDVARVNVTGGTLTGPNWPPSRRATLDPATTVRVAGGTLAGGLNLANPSTTPGSYALEAESGGGPATLYGPTASLRKSTAGAATFSGEVNLNSIRVEAGSLTFAHGPALTANTVEVAGGSLQSNKNATIGTLRLSGGTTTLTRATTVTNALQGSATLIADGSFDLDLSSAMIDFTGTLRVANTSPATSGNLLVVLPSGGPPSGALAHWTFDNASNLGADRMNRYNGTLMGTTPPQPAAGRIGGAIDFEQANAQYIDLPDGMANFNTGITVAAWMNYESFTNWNRIIDFGNGAGVDNIVFARQGTSANLRWEFFNTVGGTETHDINTGQFVNSQWMHIAATVRDRDGNPATANDSDSIIYLNGVAFPTKTDHSLPRNITRVNNYIGESNWGGDDFLDGLMDELFVYNRPLSATEVQALYNAGVAGSYAGTGLTPGLGNLRLDPSSRITLGGAGVATFESVGATDGLTINRGLTLGPAGGAPARVEGTNTGVHFDAAIAATSFEVTGAGTVSLGNNSSLTVASGGTLSVPQGTSLSTSGNVTVDASQGSVSYKGGLNVASGTLTLNAPGGAALPSGAIARWTFDNAANLGRDSAGSYNGTLMGSTPPAQAQGMIGGAIDFERDFGNFVDLPDGFANFTTGITVAAWVKYESYTTWNRIIDFGNGAPSNNILLARQGTSANLRWELFGTAGGTETQDVNTGQFINGQWLHIVATVAPGGTNTSVSTIYVNGVPVSVKGDSTLPPNVTRVNNYIGESNWGGDDFLDGLMDELVIYNRTLNATEVQNLYRAGIQGGYGAARFGDLSMAPATRLVAATQPVGFSSATLGDGAILTGDITLDRRLTVAGAATVNGPGGNDGDLRISDGLAYDWSFRRGGSDLMTILGDLHFDSSFTLRIFGEGGTILPTDYVPIFLYSGILEVAGGANPLQYTIEIGNLSDPDNLYIWDATNAELIAGLHEGQQGIWLHGLFAQPVPEPGTLGVLALGVLALLRRRRRRG